VRELRQQRTRCWLSSVKSHLHEGGLVIIGELQNVSALEFARAEQDRRDNALRELRAANYTCHWGNSKFFHGSTADVKHDAMNAKALKIPAKRSRVGKLRKRAAGKVSALSRASFGNSDAEAPRDNWLAF